MWPPSGLQLSIYSPQPLTLGGAATMCVGQMGTGLGLALDRDSVPALPKLPSWKGLDWLFIKDPNPWGSVPGAQALSALFWTHLCSFFLMSTQHVPDPGMCVPASSHLKTIPVTQIWSLSSFCR